MMSCYPLRHIHGCYNKIGFEIFASGLASILFAIAGLAFWVGSRTINEFAKTDRMLAEMEGIGLATLSGG
jgi:hypothetical protein